MCNFIQIDQEVFAYFPYLQLKAVNYSVTQLANHKLCKTQILYLTANILPVKVLKFQYFLKA